MEVADIVKLRSRSRSGEGQSRVRKVKETKDLDLSYTLFLVFTQIPFMRQMDSGRVGMTQVLLGR